MMEAKAGLFSRITSPAGINYLNIALMLISLVAAYILPFELFLFSYAVLGPLHYLTEISWLEKKDFFVRSRNDIWILVILVCIITLGMFNQQSRINAFMGSLLFSGFVYALIILFVEKAVVKIFLIVGVFVVSVLFNVNQYPDTSFLLFAVWLPTIIHVFLFTGAFILYGALRSRSASGVLSLLVFIACAVMFFLYKPGSFLEVTEYGRKAYSFFRLLNASLYELFGFGKLSMADDSLYMNTGAVAIMRFIAFAYTYHYLNWFSKTTVIKWNKVSRKRMSVIILLWILSVVLYVFSYTIGFYALFLLSMLHVFFEFPLNHQTFIGIGKELRAILRR